MSTLTRFIVFSILFMTACGEEKNLLEPNSSSEEGKNNLGKPLKGEFELVAYPETFLKENGLEEWEHFQNVYESMDRLKSLDLRKVEVNILALSTRIKNILDKQIPGDFETPQVRSRLKVVYMQTQKAKYFTRHYKNDSLIPSLQNLYENYNALINRMIILKQETSTVVSDSATRAKN